MSARLLSSASVGVAIIGSALHDYASCSSPVRCWPWLCIPGPSLARKRRTDSLTGS